MKQETLNIIISFGGVILGFLLSMAHQWVFSLSQKRNARRTLRHMIGLEVRSNLLALEEFWKEILAREQEWKQENDEIVESHLGRIIANLPFPRLGTHIWYSNTGRLPDAFSSAEIEELWTTYRNMLLLSNLHEHFCLADADAADSSRHHQRTSGILSSLIGGWTFLNKTGAHIGIFKEKIEGLLERLRDDILHGVTKGCKDTFSGDSQGG